MDLVGPNQREIKKVRSFVLRLFVLPIFVIVIFFVFLLVGIIPNLSRTFNELDQIAEASRKYDEQVAVLKSAQSIALGVGDINNNLAKINTLASQEEQTTVALFQDKIATIAKEEGLIITGQETGEKILNQEGQALPAASSTTAPGSVTVDPNAIGIIEIPSIFNLEGKLPNIKRFIARLNQIDDFIIVGELSLTAKQKTDEKLFQLNEVDWSLELDLLKYQFQTANEANDTRAKYLAVPLTSQPDKSVLDYINRTNSSGLTIDVVED
jgi:hypothetical protein